MKRLCTFPVCDNPVKGHGLCDGHYQQRCAGKPLTRLTSTLSDADRFWAKVDFLAPEEHWIWAANKVNGYGHFAVNGKTVKSHRWAYEQLIGPIPDGMEIDHICRLRACINPAHLRLATRNQNQENTTVPSSSTSGVRGVTWARRQRRWKVHAMHKGRTYHGGYYRALSEAEQAAKALRNRLFTHNDTDRRVS